MERQIQYPFFRAKHFLLIALIFTSLIQLEAQSFWGFSGGYQYHSLTQLGGFQGDLNMRIPLLESVRLELGLFYNVARGNHPDLSYDNADIPLLFETIQFRNPNPGTPRNKNLAYFRSPKSSFSNMWGFRFSAAKDIWKYKRSSVAFGVGMHISYVKFNIIHQVNRVTLLEDFTIGNTPILVDLPLPMVHHFIAYSLYIQAPYTVQLNEHLQAVFTPYYSDMRGFNGFWGLNVGIMVKI